MAEEEEEEECFYSTIQCNTMIRIKDIYREQFGQETPIKMQLASLSWEPPEGVRAPYGGECGVGRAPAWSMQALQGVHPAPTPIPLQHFLGHPESPGDPTIDEWLADLDVFVRQCGVSRGGGGSWGVGGGGGGGGGG